MKPWCTLCWIPIFRWEFRGRWGAGDDFSGPDCISSMEPVARGGVLHHSPKHLQEGKGLPFGKARFSPCSPLSMEGRRLPASLQHMQERGNREPCCHLFPTNLSPNRSKVAHSALFSSRLELHIHTAKPGSYPGKWCVLPVEYNECCSFWCSTLYIYHNTVDVIFSVSWGPFSVTGQDLLSLSQISAGQW